MALGSIPGLGRSPGGGHGNQLWYSCLENPHGQRSLTGYSPWGRKESDTIEQLSTGQHIMWPYGYPWRRKWQPTPVFLPGELHGQRLPCLQATVHGVAKCWTRLSDVFTLHSLDATEATEMQISECGVKLRVCTPWGLCWRVFNPETYSALSGCCYHSASKELVYCGNQNWRRDVRG